MERDSVTGLWFSTFTCVAWSPLAVQCTKNCMYWHLSQAYDIYMVSMHRAANLQPIFQA